MTMQQCKDHLAMVKSDPVKKDTNMDKSCSDRMKKDGMAMAPAKK